MEFSNSRRQFIRLASAGGAALSLGNLGFLQKLPRVSAAEAKLNPNVVRFSPEIEPIVRLLEETPREKLLEKVADRIRGGLSYRELLAALLLAGVRNVEPRPSVGHKFHAVLVVNSAHLASISSPDEHRWLPIFWALDYFKESQAEDEQERGWTMAPVDESALPSARRARKAFIKAMDNWDVEAADAAVVALARSASSDELFELFSRYGARDFRSIGHKAIYVSNSWRTLNCIGWHYAEPVLRSLAYALLMHEGSNPAQRDDAADLPGRENLARVGEIRPTWRDGQLDDGATESLLSTLRNEPPKAAPAQVVELLNAGVAPQSVWDALFSGAGELLIRQPGIVALHAVTTTNALRYAFETSADDETRRLLMLQNAAFLPMFREAMHGRGSVEDFQITDLQPAEAEGEPPALLDSILDHIHGEPMTAAREVLTYLHSDARAEPLIEAARVLIFLKGTNAHDYKFSSAVLEDYYHLSPRWRDGFLASSVFSLRGTGDRDNDLSDRTRAALAG